MKTGRLWILLFGLSCSLAYSTRADIVTLNSGETVTGRILSETDAQVAIETSNAKGTIFSTRQIAKNEIKEISRETPEQKREKTNYEALAKYKLYQNQELTEEQYTAGIAAFKIFLQNHPPSVFSTELTNRISAWQAELNKLADGQVKFADKWMTPGEKSVQSINSQNNQQLQSSQSTVELLQVKLSALQKNRSQIAANLAGAQGSLAAKQSLLTSLQDTQAPIYREISTPARKYNEHGVRVYGGVDTTRRVLTGDFRTVPNPDRPSVASSVAVFHGQVIELQGTLSDLDAKIRDVQAQLNNAQQATQLASLRQPQQFIKVQTQSTQVQTQPPQVRTQLLTQQPEPLSEAASPSASPAPSDAHQSEPEEHWLNKNWKWIGGFMLVGVALFVFSRR